MAKRFRFRLAVLKRVRGRVRDSRRFAVANQARVVADARRHVNVVERRLAESIRRIRMLMVSPGIGVAATESGEGLDVESIRLQRLHHSQQLRVKESAMSELDAQSAALMREQTALAEATKAVRILDRLEHRQRREHALELARAERVVEDEMASIVARRGHAEASECEWHA